MREHTSSASLNALSAPEAQALFHELADNGRIPFNYAQMGCDYRAYQMRGALQKMGYAPQLAWAVEAGAQGPLFYQSPEDDHFTWWFHVAVALPVETAAGRVEMCIFDPAIFDGPVRLPQWVERVNATPQYFGIHDFDDESVGDMPHPAVAVRARMRQLDQDTVYERTNEIFRHCRSAFERQRLVYPSQLRADAEAEVGYPFMRRGKTWISTAFRPAVSPPAAQLRGPR